MSRTPFNPSATTEYLHQQIVNSSNVLATPSSITAVYTPDDDSGTQALTPDEVSTGYYRVNLASLTASDGDTGVLLWSATMGGVTSTKPVNLLAATATAQAATNAAVAAQNAADAAEAASDQAVLDIAAISTTLGDPDGDSVSADIAAIDTSGGGLTTEQAAQLTAIQSKTALITADGVVNNAVSTSSTPIERDIVVYRGSDYSEGVGNNEAYSQAGWPSSTWETGTTATFKYSQSGGSLTTAGTVTVTHDSDETVTAKVAFTDTETDAMTAYASGSYEVELINSSSVRMLAVGKLAVRDRVS